MKKQQLIITGVIISIVIIAIIIYKKMISNKANSLPENSQTSKSANTGKSIAGFSCKYGNEFPLRYGSCGEKVKELQKILNIRAPVQITVDGQFGYKTQARVLTKFGKTSITENDWNTFVKTLEKDVEIMETNVTEIKSDFDIVKLVVDINSDLSQTYLIGRREAYPWDILANQSVENLKKIATEYIKTYKKDLAEAVEDASFNFSTDVDNRILSGLKAAKQA